MLLRNIGFPVLSGPNSSYNRYVSGRGIDRIGKLIEIEILIRRRRPAANEPFVKRKTAAKPIRGTHQSFHAYVTGAGFFVNVCFSPCFPRSARVRRKRSRSVGRANAPSRLGGVENSFPCPETFARRRNHRGYGRRNDGASREAVEAH